LKKINRTVFILFSRTPEIFKQHVKQAIKNQFADYDILLLDITEQNNLFTST